VSGSDDKKVVGLPAAATLADQSSAHPGPGHSDIFQRLAADNDSDLVGLVAYGLYQRRKRSWMDAFFAKEGRFPNQQERDSYAFSYRDDSIGALRGDAERVLAVFAEQLIEDRSEELRANALDAQMQAVLTSIDDNLRELRRPWRHVKGHVLGFVALVALVAIGALIVNFEPTVEGAWHWVKDHLFTTTPTPAPH
jgi:hypothetical protein